MHERQIPVIAPLLTVLILAGGASAQDALGTGHALDRNLDARYGGINPTNEVEDFRQRNLLITDDVVGGRGFRASVGYSSETAFRDNLLGSNDLFSFRRDSAWSDINFFNRGDTYQQFRYGQTMGLVEYQRSASGATFRSLDESLFRPNERLDTQLQLDRLTASSNLSAQAESASEPTNIGMFRGEEGDARIMHLSSLTGIGTTPVGQMSQLMGLSSFDFARASDDIAQRRTGQTPIGTPFETRYAGLSLGDDSLIESGLGGSTGGDRSSGRITGLAADELRNVGTRVGEPIAGLSGGESRTESGAGALGRAGAGAVAAREPGAASGNPSDDPRPGYLKIQERIAKRFSQLPPGVVLDDEPDLQDLDEGMSDLRKWLRSVTIDPAMPGVPEDPDAPYREQQEATRELPDDMKPADIETITGIRRDGTSVDDEAAADGEGDGGTVEEEPVTTTPMPIEDFGLILRHGQRIDRLAQQDQTRFNELVAGGEKMLSEGEYFFAERRFLRALRFTPGHPLATAGLAHAQIGAGLYVAAALTLHSLFVEQPEMIDASFSPALIPNRPRLLRAVEVLRLRLSRSAERESSAFLFAYIGRLLGERATVEEGLAVMAEAAPNDPLVQLLEEVWLHTDDPADAPEAADDPAPPAAPTPGK